MRTSTLKKKRSNGIFLMLAYFLLIINYRFVMVKYFDYFGFDFEYYSFMKFLVSTLYTIVFIFIYKKLKNNFYRIVYCVYLVLVFFGQVIFYIFNESNFILVIYVTIPLIILFALDKFCKEKINNDVKLKISDKFTWLFFLIVSLSMIAPFLKNYNLINIRNLFFIDIYDSRSMFAGQVGGILGYLFSPISRVVLPFLFIYSLENKKRIVTVVSIVSTLFMYLLNGALKSIFFGLVACMFFYKRDYFHKERHFLRVVILVSIISLIEPIVNDSYIITDYMRRIFFVPALLFQIYYDYFRIYPTYFLHSRIAKILGLNNAFGSAYNLTGTIPHFIGEEIMGKVGLSANVGIFAEGFLSYGTIGVIIASVIFGFIIKYLNNRKLSPAYFGMLFSYIYIIDTSFVETLFITHGLLFYLVFALFIIPKENNFC